MKFTIKMKSDQPISKLSKLWVTYGLRRSGEIFYIGSCKISHLFSLPDAVAEQIIKSNDLVEFEVLDVCENGGQAMRLQAQHIKNLGLTVKPKITNGAVHCVTTGEVFSSAAEAARIHGVTYSQLNNHLNRKPGFNTVKKKYYERISEGSPITRHGNSENISVMQLPEVDENAVKFFEELEAAEQRELQYRQVPRPPSIYPEEN